MKFYLIIFITTLFAISFSSCDPKAKYKDEISKLDSTLTVLDSAEIRYRAVPADSISGFYAKIKLEMKLIAEVYEGEMDKDRAFLLSQYRDIPNFIKNFPQVYGELIRELEKSKTQIQSLKKALEEGAGKDSMGNKINKEYAIKYSNDECTIAAQVVAQIDKIEEKFPESLERYNELYPQLSGFFDSLRTIQAEQTLLNSGGTQ